MQPLRISLLLLGTLIAACGTDDDPNTTTAERAVDDVNVNSCYPFPWPVPGDPLYECACDCSPLNHCQYWGSPQVTCHDGSTREGYWSAACNSYCIRADACDPVYLIC